MPAIHPHILKLAHDLQCNVFIESGTFYGTTYRKAVESGFFERVYSVEIVEWLYQETRRIYGEDGPYKVFLGKAHEVLEVSIFPDCGPDDRVFFWLDGHYSAGVTGGGEQPCPLLDELAAIRDFCPTQSVVIVIDDTDDLGRTDPNAPGLNWPSRDEVERVAYEINPNITVIDYTGNDSRLEKIYRGVLVFAFHEPSADWKNASVERMVAEESIRVAGRSLVQHLITNRFAKAMKKDLKRIARELLERRFE